MRQIYQTWGSSSSSAGGFSNNNNTRDKTILLTPPPSIRTKYDDISNTSPQRLDSSFEANNTSSGYNHNDSNNNKSTLSSSSSFLRKKQGSSVLAGPSSNNNDRGSVEAIQFVPAFEESLSPTTTTTRTIGDRPQPNKNLPQQESLDTSWDVIAGSDSSTIRSTTTPSYNTPGGRRYSSSVVGPSTATGRHVSGASSAIVTPSPNTKVVSRVSKLYLQSKNHQQQQQQQRVQNQPDDTKSMSCVSSSTNTSARPGGGGRIARLASLFSSRAIVPSSGNETRNATTSVDPVSGPPPSKAAAAGPVVASASASASPPGSESSSGYIGWPGTQDKRGGTVVVESSYEESDVGMGVKDYQRVVEENVNREVSNWMNDSQCGDSDSEQSSPQRSHTRGNNHQSSGQAATPPPPAFAPSTHSSSSPPRSMTAMPARQDLDKVHRLVSSPARAPTTILSPLSNRIHSIQEVYGQDGAKHDDGDDCKVITTMTDPWSDTLSDLSTSYSKTSSAYFNPREVQAIRKGKTDYVAAVRQNRQAAAAVMRRQSPQQQQQQEMTTVSSQQRTTSRTTRTLTEESLALKDHYSPPHRTYNASNAVGFRGLLNKSQDVPNLMDDVASDTASSVSGATSRYSSSNDNRKTYFDSRSTRQQQQERIDEEDDFGSQLTGTKSNNFDDSESDVFDGLSAVGGRPRTSVDGPTQDGRRITPLLYPSPEEENDEDEEEDHADGGILGARSRTAMSDLNVALLGGGLTAIQTTVYDFTGRKTASDFDDNLTNSDYDQYGFAKLPTFREMAVAGRNQHDRSLSAQSLQFAQPSQRVRQGMVQNNAKKRDNGGSGLASGSESGSSLFSDHYPTEEWGHNVSRDLSIYYVHPEEMKILVRKFRKMSRDLFPRLDYDDLEREEDATKAFALSEMRSRIMEKDIERGLERRGGTTVVDDIVMTPFNQAALRVRDAVIVAKAWRDGATPQDVINTSLLTRRSERTFYIPRHRVSPRGVAENTWEEVTWIDDMEMSRYRCHSIGPRHLKGTEMFTIGDCQSILLKLCNERCQELRRALNKATKQQIEAEEEMKAEGEGFDDGMMTEAEMTYLTSMEEVKTISLNLVLAEKAFTLVRDRIEKLVAKYEALLVRFDSETESVAPSSIFTSNSSYYSEDYSYASAEEREKEVLTRRAERAELRAELAAREAMLSKQQAKSIRDQKEQELNTLKARLVDLQSESSAAITEREHSVVLARAITANSRGVGSSIQARKNGGSSSGPVSGSRISRSKIDDIKKRFRDRSAAKNSTGSLAGSDVSPSNLNRSRNPPNSSANTFYRTVGEEMYQQLDFYERSLKAVEETR
jgi:hypothetical protein